MNFILDVNFFVVQELFELFRDYSCLWKQDINQTFKDFLQGNATHNPLRDSSRHDDVDPSNIRAMASARSASR